MKKYKVTLTKEEELRRPRRELDDVKEERDILKKAVGIYSKIQQ